MLNSLAIALIALQLPAQQDENIRNQKIDELTKNMSQLEKSLNENIKKTEGVRKSQITLEEQVMKKISESEVSTESKLAEFELEMEQFVKVNSSELSVLKEEFVAQKNLREKIHKRQKVHFLVLYIFLFVALIGVVFVYIYYGKVLKDYDMFHQKRIEDLKAETHRTVDANHKYLISKVDTSCDEVRALLQKNKDNLEQSKTESNNQMLLLSEKTEKRFGQIEKTVQSANEEQKEMKKLIAENAKLGEMLQTLSAKFSQLEEETKKQIESLSKAEKTKTAPKKETKPRARKKPE